MRSLSEIDTISKRALRAKGFSWGVSEEIGKSVKQLELFGLPGLKNLNQYLKIYDRNKFQQIKLLSKTNISENKFHCPISLGIGFLDQVKSFESMMLDVLDGQQFFLSRLTSNDLNADNLNGIFGVCVNLINKNLSSNVL